MMVYISIPIFIFCFVYSYYIRSTVNSCDKYHTFWPRFWAFLIDSMIFGAVDILCLMMPGLFWLPSPILFVFAIVSCFGRLIYTVYFHGKYGQTFGKFVCKIKVVQEETENNIDWKLSFRRDYFIQGAYFAIFISCRKFILSYPEHSFNLTDKLSLFAIFSLLFLLADVITMSVNKKRRAYHDRMGGTVVIRTNIKQRTGGESRTVLIAENE